MTRRALAVVCALAALCALADDARARLVVRITEGVTRPLTLAAAPMEAEEGLAETAASLSRAMIGNLTRTGLMRAFDPAAAPPAGAFGVAPRFVEWRPLGVDAVVKTRLARAPRGALRLDLALWDVFGAERALAQGWILPAAEARRLAHVGANAVYERLTGESGPFDAQIAFIAESGGKGARVKRLAVMDQDGQNIRHLTDGEHVVLTPRFDPEGKRILYMSYAERTPQVFLFDVASGKRSRIGSFPGMTYAPRFAPDGRDVLMSLETRGESNIFRYSLTERTMTALTDNAAIDTGASYSPDGRSITFESDRDGKQQIYVMNADGTNPRRISFGDGAYGTPVWSPRGDLIAFTKYYEGRFLIGVMRPDGSGERAITAGFHNEGPSWAPNGRSLMFFRDTPGKHGGPHLWSVDITGYNERPIITPTFASDPAWGPPRAPPETLEAENFEKN